MKHISKVLKVLLALLLIAAFILPLAACKDKDGAGTGTAYGLVHNYYVGIATVKTMPGAEVGEVKFEEVMTPYDWAAKKNISSTIVEEDFFEEGYAKKIMIGDKVFVGTIVNDGKKTYADYQCEELNNKVALLNWLKHDSNAKWYADKIMEGSYWILNAADSKIEDLTYKAASNDVNLSKGERWLKSKNGYWTVEETLGWSGNMDKLAKFFKEDGMKDSGTVNRLQNPNNEDKYEWTVGNTNTGATLIDFNDYINIAKIAYAKAIKG